MSLRVLDRKALRAKGVYYSNVHLLRLEAENKFPKRFNLTENRVAWLEEEVDLWIRERVAASGRTAHRPAEATLAGSPLPRPPIEDTGDCRPARQRAKDDQPAGGGHARTAG